MAIGAIPWSAIVHWCKLHDIHDIDDIATTTRYFRAMEAAEYAYDNKRKPNDK